MSFDPRVQGLIEEVLDTGRSAEAVCRDSPELLARVREGLRKFRAMQAQVGALFPEAGSADPDATIPMFPEALPQVPGYDVTEELGRGGVGVVYKARHLRLNRPVGLKMLLAGAYASRAERRRLSREAELVAELRHPNIVQVYDVGDLDGRPYFTMELIEGGSLDRKLAGRPLPAREAASLLAVLAGAVDAAHRAGIVHRDLKPANVLLADDGTPKISDFGLARQLGDGLALTLSGAPLGTPSYMAPEQAQGRSRETGPAADLYALGAILYELLTGRPPFRAESAAATVQQVLFDDPVPPSRLNPRGAARPGDRLPEVPAEGPAPSIRHSGRRGRRPGPIPSGSADRGPAGRATGTGPALAAAEPDIGRPDRHRGAPDRLRGGRRPA